MRQTQPQTGSAFWECSGRPCLIAQSFYHFRNRIFFFLMSLPSACISFLPALTTADLTLMSLIHFEEWPEIQENV